MKDGKLTSIDNIIEEGGTSSQPITPANLKFDPWRYLDVFRRRFWLFLMVLVIIAAAAEAYDILGQKSYESVASVMIEPQRADPVKQVGAVAVDSEERIREPGFVETQAIILASPEVANATVDALNLTADSEFGGQNSNAPANVRKIRAIKRLANVTAIRRSGLTSVVEVAVRSRSPDTSIAVSNEIARQYLARLAQLRADQQNGLNAQVDGRLAELRATAQRTDAALQAYKISHSLMNAQGSTMAEQETSSLNQQIASARAALAQAVGRLAAARHQGISSGGSDTASALNSGTIGALRQQEADSSRTLAQLRARYGAKHPSVIQEENRLADVKLQIQAEINRIQSSLEGEVAVASSGLSSLLASQSEAKGRLATNAHAQVGLDEVQRDADSAKMVYDTYLATSRDASAHNGITPPVATISSLASMATTTVKPNSFLIQFLGLLFGIAGGLFAIILAEIFDAGINVRGDVERRLDVRYLGAIPDLRLGSSRRSKQSELPELYIVSHPMSAFAETIRSVRTAVTLARGKRPKVLAVASALPNEGKTTTAVCLGRTLAMAGESTLLVDCDLRRHNASRIVLGENEGRLLDVLNGTMSIEDALVKDSLTNLMVLGSTVELEGGANPLSSQAVRDLFDRLRPMFDFIILDTSPILGVADARVVAAEADACVLLARWRKTAVRTVDVALEMLIAANVPVSGIALTQVNVAKFGSNRDDIYGYRNEFKGYYRD